jgi:hypothetical protein
MVEFSCKCGHNWIEEVQVAPVMSLQFLVANPCIECGNMPYRAERRPSRDFYKDRDAMNAKDIAIAKSLGIKL